MSDRNIRLKSAGERTVEDQEVEIVEQKGIGHPDSISDGIAESISRVLSNLYLDRVDKVLYYNTDETQLVADTAAPAFGGGEVIEPIYLLIVSHATKGYDGKKIPVDSTVLRAAREYLNENVPRLDVDTDIIVDVKLGEGPGDLQDVFGEEAQQVPMANDTSFGVGRVPLTETERIALETERTLSDPAYDNDHPELGQDIKLIGKREGDVVDVAVAAAMVDKHPDDIDDYVAAVDDVHEFVSDLATDYTDREVNVEVNTADDYDEGSIYLTTTGTSAEQDDDGSVGRSNRANGLIMPNRPVSMEATSGENPVNHIGEIYNLLSTHIAEAVVDKVNGIRDLQVHLLSQIDRPIDEPHVADAKVVTDDGVTIADIKDEVIAIIDREPVNVTDITHQTIEGELSTS